MNGQGIKVIRIQDIGTMKACTKFQDNQSNSCQDISVTMENVNELVETSRDYQCFHDSS